MLSILIVQNGASKESMEATVAAASSSGLKEITAFGQSGIISDGSGIKVIDASKVSLNDAITSTMSSSNSSQVVILDARLAPTSTYLQSALGAISRCRTADMVLVPLRSKQNITALPLLRIDQMVRWISGSPEWPFMCVALNRSTLVEHMPLVGESLSESLAHLMVKMMSAGQSVTSADNALSLPIALGTESSLRMSSEALSRILQTLVDENNIEELYPNHAWEAYEQESAAAAYHDLAAHFVRLGGLDLAQECLRLSDTFEDSPRSLALKGIIARLRGETLGAVANMVASLQQYEARKSNDGSHYLSFAPMNVEKISDDMQAGLEALNNSDNETALQYFSKAVSCFDPFFADSGLLQ